MLRSFRMFVIGSKFICPTAQGSWIGQLLLSRLGTKGAGFKSISSRSVGGTMR